MPIRICLLIAVLGSVVPAQARDIFVSNRSGDDRQDGRAMRQVVPGGGPVRSIRKALRLAQAGDRIVVENTGQPYRETLSLIGSRHSGGIAGPLVIEGQGAVLDGSVPLRPDAWEPVSGDVFACRPARLGHQQLFLDGRPARRVPSAKMAAAPPDLQPLEWCLWHGQILLRVEPGRLPQDYLPACCGLQTGITLYYVRDLVIRDLVVQGYAVDGVAVHDVVRDARLERVVSRDNGKSGFSARGASWAELDACSAAGNGESQLRIEDFARLWTYRCQFSGTTAPAVDQQGGELHQSREPFSRSLP